jgi:hypothetical protein
MPSCGWDISNCCGDCGPYQDLDNAMQQQVDEWAINRLWEWTNRRFGPCEVTYTNESEECCWLFDRYRSMCRSSELILPGPIAEPLEVIVADEEVDVCELRVDDYAYLVRLDGGNFHGAWEVTYLKGEPIPPGGELIAGILACEYAKTVCNDPTCKLPKRLTTVAREGLTMGMIDNFTGLSDGFTGIWVIDDWIATNNAKLGPWKASTVSSPDIRRPRLTTWTCSESS